jgi:hypothetical protein
MHKLLIIALFLSGCTVTKAGIRRQAEWRANECRKQPSAAFRDGMRVCVDNSVAFCVSNGLEPSCATGLWASP